jgi:sugar phosphate isomerase/epimerase
MRMNLISQTIPLQYDTVFSPFKASEFSYALEYLEKKGFTGVELAVAYPELVSTIDLIKELEKYNLVVTTLSTGQIYGLKGFFLSSQNEDIRRQAIKTVKEHIELSVKLNYPPVTIGLIRGKLEKGDPPILLNNLKASLIECVEYAYKRNVVLQLEPICKLETVLINSTYDALDLLNSLGNPENLGILYDTYHSYIEDGDMISAINAAAGKITNVHFSDSHRGLPGYGTIDFQSIYKALMHTSYKGAIVLEALCIPTVEFVKENFAASIHKIISRDMSA